MITSALIHTFVAALLAFAPLAAADQDITVSHGIAMHGDLKYGPDFKHFDYVNPRAPKGGDVRLSAIGTLINKNSPSFDPCNYHCQKLGELVRKKPYLEVKRSTDKRWAY